MLPYIGTSNIGVWRSTSDDKYILLPARLVEGEFTRFVALRAIELSFAVEELMVLAGCILRRCFCNRSSRTLEVHRGHTTRDFLLPGDDGDGDDVASGVVGSLGINRRLENQIALPSLQISSCPFATKR